MKKARLNFANLKIKDIEGNNIDGAAIKSVCESFGNTIYFNSFDIPTNELGPKVYRCGVIEFEEKQKEDLKTILNDRQKCALAGFIVIGLNKAIDEAWDKVKDE